LITEIEELSLNAWASLQTLTYDGWILRFADGYTKRANSVNPLYPSSIDVYEKIHFCEQLYRKKNLPVVFKMTPAALPNNLDEVLNRLEYQKDSPTSVQTIDLGSTNNAGISGVEIQNKLSDEWLDNFCRLSGVSTTHVPTLQKILLNIVPDYCFVSLKTNQNIVACDMGVLQSGIVGLFDIVTDKDFRNFGYGRQIVESILNWGLQNNARRAYLQVMLNNAPALHLYSKIGFTEQYQYWYRVRS